MKIFSNKKENQDDLFMRIQLVILNDKVNLNGAVCTKEFIQGIVDNSKQYEHLPLFCDLDALRQHKHLSHNYDPERDEYGTSQIGSFESFTTTEVDGVLYLVGTAKVSKRNRYIVDALERLADRDDLKFSYEIETSQTYNVDGVEYITGDSGNKLVGVAVVTEPAIPEAKALMVAEREQVKEDDPVAEKKIASDEEQVEEKLVEDEEAVETEESVEETVDEEAVEETAEDNDGGKEQLIELSALKDEFAALKERCAALEEELKQRKENDEEKAKAEKKQELIDKVSDVLDEEEIEGVKNAIENLDENAVNAALAAKLIKENVHKKKIASRKPAGLRITDSCGTKKNKWITEN